MCLCLGQGSFGWHLTIVVSVFLPARTSTQCFPFHTGVKISVTTVTTVKPRVAALCIAVDPPTWLAALIRWAKGAARRNPNAPVIGASSGGADSYCEGTSLIRRAAANECAPQDDPLPLRATPPPRRGTVATDERLTVPADATKAPSSGAFHSGWDSN